MIVKTWKYGSRLLQTSTTTTLNIDTNLFLSTKHCRPATWTVMYLPVFILFPVMLTFVPPDLGPFFGLKSRGSGSWKWMKIFLFLKHYHLIKTGNKKTLDFWRKALSNVTDPVKYVFKKHRSSQLDQAGLKLNQSLKVVPFTAPSKSLLHTCIYLFIPIFIYLYL